MYNKVGWRCMLLVESLHAVSGYGASLRHAKFLHKLVHRPCMLLCCTTTVHSWRLLYRADAHLPCDTLCILRVAVACDILLAQARNLLQPVTTCRQLKMKYNVRYAVIVCHSQTAPAAYNIFLASSSFCFICISWSLADVTSNRTSASCERSCGAHSSCCSACL